MLDKSTTNIQCKETWPQKNLGEEWEEEEVEFKQLRFEHLVAGETRTIETCTDLAQILGRLRLLRRISYLKLRGGGMASSASHVCGHTKLYRNWRVLLGIQL